MPFEAIESHRLYQRVAEQIAALIRGGELKPGERLPPERDLCRQLGVSRPVLREAMIVLEMAGLVEVRTGAGAYVTLRRPTAPLADTGPGSFDLLAARRLLEGEIAWLAAQTATPDGVARLEEALAAHRAAIKGGSEGIEWDREFHLSIARITGNDYLLRMAALLWGDVGTPMFTRLAARTHNSIKFRTTLADHERILACIERGEAAGARTAMHDHIRHVEQFFLDDTAAAPAASDGPSSETGAS